MSDPAILQLEAWREIIHSPGWVYFKELVQEHIDYLDKQVHIAVESGKFNDAMKYQAKATDWKTIIGRVNERILELKGGTNDSNER